MNDHISKIRSEYYGEPLNEASVSKDPLVQFGQWFWEAINAEVDEPTAVVLATASKLGAPAARIVLLKNYGYAGFTFYTNYHSRKGKDLSENPQAGLLFYWPQLFRQVRIEGTITMIDAAASEKYFGERPRESRIAAWVSPQSQVIEHRDALEIKYLDFAKANTGKEIPRPAFWGGYCLKPVTYEFWQGRPNRLHDRLCYNYNLKTGNHWQITRLAP